MDEPIKRPPASARKSVRFDGQAEVEEEEATSDQAEIRSKTARVIARIILYVTLIDCIFTGLLINLLQLALKLSLQISPNQTWRSWNKMIIGKLLYFLNMPLMAYAFYWTRMTFRVVLANPELEQLSKMPIMAVLIPNHSYDLDYIICLAASDQMGNMGSYKSFAKDELKYMPVFGWALWMSDTVFVKRDWARDRKSLGKKLGELLDYDQNILGVFAEGTRFTPEKHLESCQVAQTKGLEPFKYHLLPKKRGFLLAMKHFLVAKRNDPRLQTKPFKLINMQILQGEKYNFTDFLEGRRMKADIYIEEVTLSEDLIDKVVRSKDDDDDGQAELSQLLFDIYRRKDEIVDEYRANHNVMPLKNGSLYPVRAPIKSVLAWFLQLAFTLGTCSLLIITNTINPVTFWSVLVAFLSLCVLVERQIDHQSRCLNSNKTTKTTKDLHDKSADNNNNTNCNNSNHNRR